MFTDNQRLHFLLQTEAELKDFLADGELSTLAENRPKYITNYIGSKQKLIDWIWAQTPENAKSVLDAFSGSSVVGYMYKQKGLSVISNDRLRYSYHAAKAIVENDNVTLSDEEIDSIIANNSNARKFVQETFRNTFYAKGVDAVIDNIRTNIESLTGYKKDIALFALGRTCLSAKSGFGHFGTTKQHDERMDSPEQFKERFKKYVQKINTLVFKNEQSCKAYNEDVNSLLPKLKVDVAYYDPPYATEFSLTNYEKSYHFIEGLMTYWKDKEVDQSKKTKMYNIDYKGITKKNASQFFTDFLSASKHIPYWILSYRDRAYPNEKEIKKIIALNGKNSRMKTKEHQYQISSKRSDSTLAKEHLFVCSPAERASTSANITSNISTRITGAIIKDSLTTEASKEEDKRFKFILTHAGTNRNGDHFTIEELKLAADTAITKKIDLQHSQEFKDIVGGIEDSWFVEDGKKSRVEGTGELFTEDSESSRLAYKLLKKGIVSHVSMECDYHEGECSICGKKVKTKADYCTHLKNYKGRSFQNKPVFEILHGITFTGLGLLDREGADTGAQIKEVANFSDNLENSNFLNNSNKLKNSTGSNSLVNKGETMADKDKNAQDEFNNTPPDESNTDELVKRLKTENERLKRELETAKKKIEELEASQKAAERRTKAEKLLKEWEKRGRKFDNDDAREKELNRLSSLSDDGLTAAESVVMTMAEIDENSTSKNDKNTTSNDDKNQTSTPESKDKQTQTFESQASSNYQGNPKADAGVKPNSVNDQQTLTLEERLTKGILQAYQARNLL